MKVSKALFICIALMLLFSSISGTYSADRVQAQEEPQTGGEVQGAYNTVEIRLSFSFAQPEAAAGRQGYELQGDRISIIPQIPGLHIYNVPGEPMVPFKTAKVLIPWGQEVQDIEVTRSAKVGLGKFFIQPGQRQASSLRRC